MRVYIFALFWRLLVILEVCGYWWPSGSIKGSYSNYLNLFISYNFYFFLFYIYEMSAVWVLCWAQDRGEQPWNKFWVQGFNLICFMSVFNLWLYFICILLLLQICNWVICCHVNIDSCVGLWVDVYTLC